jgi:hypothetical protein
MTGNPDELAQLRDELESISRQRDELLELIEETRAELARPGLVRSPRFEIAVRVADELERIRKGQSKRDSANVDTESKTVGT